ncbi:hypothetical protein [Robinsoniella peoriensis]|uniref:hypothetical protein n=1 Tax=Robinsoniella peoriensis TaxID=180332 RepID=UPI00362E08DD
MKVEVILINNDKSTYELDEFYFKSNGFMLVHSNPGINDLKQTYIFQDFVSSFTVKS